MIVKIKRTFIGIIAISLAHIGWNHITGIALLDLSLSFISGYLIGYLAVNYKINEGK